MEKILIVEDDRLTAELERDYLEANGYETELCGNGTDGLALAQENVYALILLDVMLPGMDGFEICRQVRRKSNVPIILVSGRQEDIDKIRGLGLGADDYIVKPFSPAELAARVKAHIEIHRRLLQTAAAEQTETETLDFGELKILVPARKVFVNGREAELKNREFELLLFLASNPGVVFSRETIFDRVWGMNACGDTATVTVHINRLREKIEKDPADPVYIQTVWGVGYRFSDRGDSK
ncbi:MAG: response regulator transcription factor [Oscillospiraceae bacterium]|nr:response regulator transcription factor [Oscillospiraceae bacterium]